MNEVNATLQRFNDELLLFPSYVAAYEEIKGLLSLHRETGVAQHLIVLGESGTGKTTLCHNLLAEYPRESVIERDIVPVLHVAIPPAATIASLMEAILRRLGDPSPTSGTVSVKMARVIKLIKALSVELVLIDEAQHIHDRGKLPSQYLVGDAIKSLMDDIGIPTILLGLPRLAQLLQVNDQLRRRFSRRRYLQLGQDDEANIETECLQFFLSLGDSLPVKISCGSYGWSEMAKRVYYACDGRVAYIKKLLAGAIRITMERGLNEIDPLVLEEAFTTEVWWEGVKELNPFNPAFVFRRLNQANEPFEQVGPGAARTVSRRKP